MWTPSLAETIQFFLKEDGIDTNFSYLNKLPNTEVFCSLKFKDDLKISGLPFFGEVFKTVGFNIPDFEKIVSEFEGKSITQSDSFEINFKAPFNIVLSAERLALNLLQRSTSVTTHTAQFVEKTKNYNLKILDTRKTTPGLRFLEKYAVNIGGGFNHRFTQSDVWMIKDNHKSIFGGLPEALEFFRGIKSFYNPIVVEIHNNTELKQAIELNVKHVMLDNYSKEMIQEALGIKPKEMTYELSDGINLDNLQNYLFEGIDAISMGSLTYGAPQKDISLKYRNL